MGWICVHGYGQIHHNDVEYKFCKQITLAIFKRPAFHCFIIMCDIQFLLDNCCSSKLHDFFYSYYVPLTCRNKLYKKNCI